MNFSAHTRTKTEPHSVPLHLLHHSYSHWEFTGLAGMGTEQNL